MGALFRTGKDPPMRTKIARSATALSALLTFSAGAVIVAAGYSTPAEPEPRTVIVGIDGIGQSPEEWTADVIRRGWTATDAADRASACAATPAQLRAAAPHTSYDPARYDVETAIRVLGRLCAGK